MKRILLAFWLCLAPLAPATANVFDDDQQWADSVFNTWQNDLSLGSDYGIFGVTFDMWHMAQALYDASHNAGDSYDYASRGDYDLFTYYRGVASNNLNDALYYYNNVANSPDGPTLAYYFGNEANNTVSLYWQLNNDIYAYLYCYGNC